MVAMLVQDNSPSPLCRCLQRVHTWIRVGVISPKVAAWWSWVEFVASEAGSRQFPVCIRSRWLTRIMTSVTQLSAAESLRKMSAMRCRPLFIYKCINACSEALRFPGHQTSWVSEWVIEYAIFLHGLAQQSRLHKHKKWNLTRRYR